MKKFFSLLLVLTMCFSLAGCGGSNDDNKDDSDTSVKTSKKEEMLDLEIAESGYSMDGDYLNYGVKVHNPNKSYYIEFPTYVVTAYAEDNSVLATEDQTLYVIAPNEEIYWCGQIDCKGQTPAKVEFTTKKDTEDYTKNGKDMNSKISVDNVNKIDDEYSTSFTGIVKNDYNSSIDAAIILILRKDGAIVGGEYTFVDSVASGQSSAFEIGVYHDIDYNSYEVYTYNWS